VYCVPTNDGIQTLFEVTLPNSGPGLLSAGVMFFRWNDDARPAEGGWRFVEESQRCIFEAYLDLRNLADCTGLRIGS
jgi:hypothetical protein